MSKLAVYLDPTHGRPTDIDFIRSLGAPFVKVNTIDVQKISDIFQATPNALICVRDVARSEQPDWRDGDAVATGKRHADEAKRDIDKWRTEAAQRHIPFPDDGKLICVGANEPQVEGVPFDTDRAQWANDVKRYTAKLVAYTVAFLDQLQGYGLRGCALELGVGWPTNWGVPDGVPDWIAYEPVHAAILRGNHLLGLHEYWSHDGVNNGWKWLAGRYVQCPWTDVQIVLSEIGVDERCVAGSTDQFKRGWRAWLTPAQYVAQLADYDARIMQDPRVLAATVFMTDGSREWFVSFDTEPIHALWLSYAQAHATPALPPVQPAVSPAGTFRINDTLEAKTTVNVRLVPGFAGAIVGRLNPGQEVRVIDGPVGADGLIWWKSAGGWMAEYTPDHNHLFEIAVPKSDWDRSIDFVLGWEGVYSTDPNDKGNYTPAGELKGTKYGISALAHPDLDIKNLTRDMAIAIYKRDYWAAANCDAVSYPFCLLIFDTAVNCGVGEAKELYAQSQGSSSKFTAGRLRYYTGLADFNRYGRPWVNRVCDIMEL